MQWRISTLVSNNGLKLLLHFQLIFSQMKKYSKPRLKIKLFIWSWVVMYILIWWSEHAWSLLKQKFVWSCPKFRPTTATSHLNNDTCLGADRQRVSRYLHYIYLLFSLDTLLTYEMKSKTRQQFQLCTHVTAALIRYYEATICYAGKDLWSAFYGISRR